MLPGSSMDGTRDYTQRAGVIYGAGQDEAGIAFSNVQVSPDGKTTYFKPFAYNPRMYPRKNNPSYDPRMKPKETLLQVPGRGGRAQRDEDRPGPVPAVRRARDHRHDHPDHRPPAVLGSADAPADDPGGQTIRINGLLGVREGVLAHITQVHRGLRLADRRS